MDTAEYDEFVGSTDMSGYTQVGLLENALGLCEEAGEVAGKIKKMLRDNNGQMTPEIADSIIKELGDNMWYNAAIAHKLGFTTGDVIRANIEKLTDRKERNVLQGEGDDR